MFVRDHPQAEEPRASARAAAPCGGALSCDERPRLGAPGEPVARRRSERCPWCRTVRWAAPNDIDDLFRGGENW